MPILAVRMVKGTKYTRVKVVRIDHLPILAGRKAPLPRLEKEMKISFKFLALVHSDIRYASPAPEPSTVFLFLSESALSFSVFFGGQRWLSSSSPFG